MQEKVKAFFAADAYATGATGITIDETSEGLAVCSFLPEEKHANADGVVQGGAIYTLADFCFAVAANAGAIETDGKPDTVTLNADISYLRPAKLGEKLVARAARVKDGRTACFYEVKIYAGDDREKVVAAAVINGIKRR